MHVIKAIFEPALYRPRFGSLDYVHYRVSAPNVQLFSEYQSSVVSIVLDEPCLFLYKLNMNECEKEHSQEKILISSDVCVFVSSFDWSQVGV